MNFNLLNKKEGGGVWEKIKRGNYVGGGSKKKKVKYYSRKRGKMLPGGEGRRLS
jgi:hypothetical protein